MSDGSPHSAELDSFFPPSFWRIVEEDLNGAFGLERYEEESDFTYGPLPSNAEEKLILIEQ